MRERRHLQAWLPLAALLCVLGAAAAAYTPGLGGPFLLDDLATLPKLGAYGPVDNPATFVSYVTSGIAGPTGRPVALASFLMDAHRWPAPPWPFKLTNVLLHLLNGAMLALLLRLLSRASGLDERKALWAGVLGAGFWVLHPLFVSTTLYVVQRMAELAALFVFGGLALYVFGRERLVRGHRRSGYLAMTGGIVGGTLLGTLSKENAALLPMLAGVLEFTVFAAAGRRAATSAAKAEQPDSAPPSLLFRWILLGLPALAVVAFLAWQLRDATSPLPYRNFTIAQRLLTEPRVVLRYLYLLVIPHGGTTGLFTTVTVSRGALHPWTTLPALFAVLGLVGGALWTRRRWPALAAAVLFFFAGQLLESTSIPLELYYEHRAYLPAALLFWPVALWIARGPGAARLRAGAAISGLVILGMLTAYRAALWGNGIQLALTWMQLNPRSPRAVVWGARALADAGRDDLALARLRAASEAMPENLSIAMGHLRLACELHVFRESDLEATLYAASHARRGSLLIYEDVSGLASDLKRAPCPPLSAGDLEAIPKAALANPHFARYPALRQEFLVLDARLRLRSGDKRAGYRAFARALRIAPTPDIALTGAAELYAAHAPGLGLALLDDYRRLPRPPAHGWTMRRLHRAWLEHIGWYRDSFALVRKALRDELRAAPEGAAP